MSYILHETINPDLSSTYKNLSQVSQIASAEVPTEKSSVRLLLICNAEEMLLRYSDLGYTDSGLTARGWEQANRLASWLKSHERIDVLLSGAQLHSRFTAQRLGYALGLSVRIDPELMLPEPTNTYIELNGYDGESTTQSFQPSHRAPVQASAPGPSSEVQSAMKHLNHLQKSHSGKTIAIVMNRDSITQLLSEFMGNSGLQIELEHTGITQLSCHNNRWILNYINRSQHCPLPKIVKPVAAPESARDNEEPAQSAETKAHLQSIKKIYNKALCQGGDLTDQTRRERIQHLLDFAQLSGDSRSLDIGTGAGVLPLLLAQAGAREAIGVDISPAMLECAEYLRLSDRKSYIQRVNYRLARAQWLPFGKERFDIVTSRMMIHLNHKPENIIREAKRVLKSDGTFILAGLLSTDDPVKRATQNVIEGRRNPCHVGARSVESYRQLLTDAGFSIHQEKIAVFERELEEWLDELQASEDIRTTVREMMEAALETDAAGINTRRENQQLLFDQRLVYLKAVRES